MSSYHVKISDIYTDTTICNSAVLANSLIKRLKGLLFIKKCKAFSEFDGLILQPCKAIHSFGMNFRFDAIFIDKNYKIIKIYENFRENKLSLYVFKAKYVLEIPEGTTKIKNIKIGNVLKFEYK